MAFSSSALAVTFCMVMVCSICSLQTTVTATHTLHITHYSHEIRGGPNSTFVVAAGTPQPDLAVGAAFGSFIVFDNMMKAGASPDSQLLGRISGTAVGIVKPTSTPDNNTRVQVVMHHIFGEASKYNGSIINLVGISFYPPPSKTPVLGTTGLLEGYSGYGILEPISQTTGPPPLFLVYKWDFYLTKKKKGE